jgi:hypothetical protein
MSFTEFINYLKINNCDIVPIPSWHNTSTLRIINIIRPEMPPAYLNIDIPNLIFSTIIERLCDRLGIEHPSKL